MKHPLRVVDRRDRSLGGYDIVDGKNSVICAIYANGGRWEREFAEWIVRTANRWHRWRKFFRPHTRDDWEWERNRR